VAVHLYVTPSSFKASVSIPDGLGEDDVERALAAASGALEQITSRRFWLDPEDVTRTYTANSARMCLVDDLSFLTSVTSDGTAVTDTILEPLNANLDGKPYLWITSRGSGFSTDDARIEITGRFGWPEVPPQAEQFVQIIASKLLKRTREAPWGIVNTSGMEGAAVRLAREDPDASMLIRRLSRHIPVVA
jgi:hypothetical protein